MSSVAGDTNSVARLWTESTHDAIRRDFPAPTEHARNLWHLSALMWDAWSAYTPGTDSYFDAELSPSEPDERVAAIEEAISFGAHRLLSHRYSFAIGDTESLADFDSLLADLCFDPPADVEPGSPAAVGLAIANVAIQFGNVDGSSERTRYIDLSYRPVNEPLVVASDEIEMMDPNQWQPLELAERFTQNGQSQGPGVQAFIGSQWGSVTSFALPEPDDRGITIDPGPPPLLGSETEGVFIAGAMQVIEHSNTLGGDDGDRLVDIPPGVRGNKIVGANGGSGWPENPATGEAYAANEVPLADYGRSVAEFWADGPDSETPPGHWNTLAIAVTYGSSRQPSSRKRPVGRHRAAMGDLWRCG